MKIEDIFDKNGNWIIKGYDPYRVCADTEALEFHKKLFDEDGCAIFDVSDHLSDNSKKYSYDSNIMQYYHSRMFDYSCKGNYTAIYYWR